MLSPQDVQNCTNCGLWKIANGLINTQHTAIHNDQNMYPSTNTYNALCPLSMTGDLLSHKSVF